MKIVVAGVVILEGWAGCDGGAGSDIIRSGVIKCAQLQPVKYESRQQKT